MVYLMVSLRFSVKIKKGSTKFIFQRGSEKLMLLLDSIIEVNISLIT